VFFTPKWQNCDKFRPLSFKKDIKDICDHKMAFVFFEQWLDLHYIVILTKSMGSIFFNRYFKISNRWGFLKKNFFKKKFFKKKVFSISNNMNYSNDTLCEYIICSSYRTSPAETGIIFDRYTIFKFKLWPLNFFKKNFVRSKFFLRSGEHNHQIWRPNYENCRILSVLNSESASTDFRSDPSSSI